MTSVGDLRTTGEGATAIIAQSVGGGGGIGGAAVSALIGYYDTEKQQGESATAFFQRVEVPKVKALLTDLEQLTPESATADDFIDLAETGEFTPEVMEGECAS